MMATASSGGSDHANMICAAPVAVSTDNTDNDNSLRQLEEGRLDDKIKMGSSDRSQQEEVALLAFNKACSSRTTSSSSASAAVLTPSRNGIRHHDHSPQKLEAPSSMQHDTEDEISLNPDDLQKPGGFENSMSINDLLTESPQEQNSSNKFEGSGKNRFNGNSNNMSNHQAGNSKSSNSKNIKMGARIRHSSSITSTGSITSVNSQHEFMSSLSGLFQPISKRKKRGEEQQQRHQIPQQKVTPHSSSSTSFDHTSFELIRNNNRKQRQVQQQRLREKQHHQLDSSNHNSSNHSWKESSAVSINSGNSKDTKASSILNPMKKKKSRVSWQIGGDDLESPTTGSKPSYLNNDNYVATKRNSSWTLTDLEGLTNSLLSSGGDGGCSSSLSKYEVDSSTRSNDLTPEEQHLWTSMLQMANLSGGDHVGDAGDSLEESSSLTRKTSVQDAMNLAAAAILQADAEAACAAAAGDAAINGSRVEDTALNTPPTTEGSPNQTQPSAPSSQASPQLSTTEITPATAVAVTTLAYQEVEEYRERLRRKREEMEGIDAQQQQESSPTELSDLNALLLENATNINNAVLLQRALYALRIHRGSLIDSNNVIDPSSNNINSNSSSANSDESDRRTIFSRFSRSEHSGLDQLALNHLITMSTSMRSSGTGGTNSLRTAAQAAADSISQSQPPSPSSSDHVLQRRHTDLGSQVGAYHQNEPAPLLFRRTFGNPHRREQREASRRSTMDALHSQRMSNATDSTISLGHQQDQQVQQHENQQQRQHRRISSLDSAGGGADSNFDHSSNNEEFADTLQNPRSHTDSLDDGITARVTPCNAEEGYDRRHLGTLIESTQSQQSTSSLVSNPRTALLTAQASVRRQSLRALQMIQAVLVSDEVIEPVEAEHIPDGDVCLSPNEVDGMDMLEELLEEKEEEVRMIQDRYRRRERIWMVAVVILIVVVVALVVITVVKR